MGNPPKNETKSDVDDQLLSAISELLVSTRGQQNHSDRQYASELVGRIVDGMDERSKLKAAEFLSRLAEPPEDLQRQLIFHNAETANCILKARHVTDAVLMEAASRSPILRELIAKRPSLSEPVVNRLLFYEETVIENILLPRGEIVISNNRAARLISRVTKDSTLGSLLAKRTDLSPRLSLRLFWRVDGDSRLVILKRFNVDPRFAATIVARAFRKNSEELKVSRFSQLAKLLACVVENDDESSATAQQASQVLAQFRGANNTATIQRVADLAHISFNLARKIAEDVPGDSFAILCRALNIADKPFSRLSSIRPAKPVGDEPYSPEDRTRLHTVFRTFNRSAAVAILSYWEMDLQAKEKERARDAFDEDISMLKQRLKEEFDDDGNPIRNARRDDDKEQSSRQKKSPRLRLFQARR